MIFNKYKKEEIQFKDNNLYYGFRRIYYDIEKESFLIGNSSQLLLKHTKDTEDSCHIYIKYKRDDLLFIEGNYIYIFGGIIGNLDVEKILHLYYIEKMNLDIIGKLFSL